MLAQKRNILIVECPVKIILGKNTKILITNTSQNTFFVNAHPTVKALISNKQCCHKLKLCFDCLK